MLPLVLATLFLFACDPVKNFDAVGTWEAEFDTSNLDAASEKSGEIIGMLSMVSFTYTFNEDYSGIRNSNTMGIELNTEFKWSINLDIIEVDFVFLGEEMHEEIKVIGKNKLHFIDEEQSVQTYLIRE